MSSHPLSLSDKVAQTSIDLYNSLRNHGKPTRRPNNVEEWTVLATISLVFPTTSEIRVVSLGTGVKVLPANRLPPLGDAVHDSHAEVLAKRGFVRWMMEEAKASVPSQPNSTEKSEEGGNGSGSGSGSGGSKGKNRRRKKDKRLVEKNEPGQAKGRPMGEMGLASDGLHLLGLETILEDDNKQLHTPSLDMVESVRVNDKVESGDTSSSTSKKKKSPNTIGSPLVPTSPLPEAKRSLPMSREISGESTNSATSMSSFLDLPRAGPGPKSYHAQQSLPMSKTGSNGSTTSIKSDGGRVVPGSKAYYDSVATQSSAEDTDRGKAAGKRSRAKKAKTTSASLHTGEEDALESSNQAPEITMDEQNLKDVEGNADNTRAIEEAHAEARQDTAVTVDIQTISQPVSTASLAQDHQKSTEVHPEATADQAQQRLLVFEDGKFRLRDGAEVWLYVSTLPCGDASMLHTAAHQDPEVAMTKSLNPPNSGGLDAGNLPLQPTIAHAVRGRNGYDNFGAVRTKPGRADSTPTISLSCSDKIATWTVMGLQGAMLEPLFEPVYLTGIVVGGVAHDPPPGWQSQGKAGKSWRAVIKREIERALWGRLGSLIGRLPLPYDLHPPTIHLTDLEFNHSKPVVALTTPLEPVPSTLALSYVPALMKKGPEILFNGTRQANTWKPPGIELLKVKARALVCKMDMMRTFLTLLEDVNASTGLPQLPLLDTTMYDLKHPEDSLYQYAKTLVRGVPHNTDTLHAAFGKDLGPFDITVSPGSQYNVAFPPFSGWIISGKRFESFTRDAALPLYEDGAVNTGREAALDEPRLVGEDPPIVFEDSQKNIAVEHVNTRGNEQDEEQGDSDLTLEEVIIVNIPKRQSSTRPNPAINIPSHHRYPTPPPCFD